MSQPSSRPVDRALVEEIFLEAVETAAGERSALLDARCGADTALRSEVESLLASHDATGLVPEMAEERPFGGRYPDRIAEYRIVRPLGEGGMGVVLLAIREGAGFEQTVALKLIRGSFVDPLLARSLEKERRILALLEHPGIARLVDGGVTPEGQPYYAMEYVQGEDVLTYCDERRLDVEGRLRLFVQVCDAVHHAHRQLVVHRDLKPSNILVTREGLAKLLDFGIAKNLEPVATPEQTAQWVTPAYASPEQVAGEVVTTSSDVYALGVLLCEILTGYRPYDTSAASASELARIITEEAPRRPSDLVERGPPGSEEVVRTRPPPVEVASRRGTTPPRLARVLRGDLDLIVLKALAKEPHRRYDSAWALGEDIHRFLDGLPVEARPDSTGYRVGKFVKRHRTLVSAGAAVVVALVAGIGGVLWQAHKVADERDRAATEASRAQQVTAVMTDIFRLGDPTRSVGDTIGVRQVLEEGVRRVRESLSDDPPLQAKLLLELGRIYRNLGILSEAERLGSQALRLRTEYEAGSLAEADALGFLGLVLRDAGRRDEAVQHLRRAVELRDRLLPAPDTATATLLEGLGWEVRHAGDFEEAAALFTRALDIRREVLGPDDPLVASTMLGLASAYHDQGSFDRAEEVFRTALAGGQSAASPNPVVATALMNLGMIRRLREQYREAEPLLRTALQMREALFGPEHPDVLEAREQMAVCLSALGRFEEAQQMLAENLATSTRVLGEEHERTRNAREATALLDLEVGRYAQAAVLLDTVVVSKKRTHGGDHPGVVYSLISAGDALLEGGHPDDAAARYREALAMGERLGSTGGVYGALARHGLARVALARGEVGVADSLASEALELGRENLRDTHRYVLDMERTRARILLARGRAAEADSVLSRVLAVEREARPSPHPRIGHALALLGDARAAQGDTAGAAEAWRAARAEFVHVLPEHPALRHVESALAALDGGAER